MPCASRVFVVAALSLAAVGARASGNYPGDIADHLGGPAPACTLCHASPGGGGPGVTAVASAMAAEGLTGGANTTAMLAAIDALDAAGTDSDGDEVSDVDELRAGTDPNVAGSTGGGGDTPPAPAYGFGCAASPVSTDAPLLAALAVFAVAGLARRRRSRG